MSDLVMRLVEENPPRLDPRIPAWAREVRGLSSWACSLCGRAVNIRRYPALEPPAVFADCIHCHLTWELAPEGNVPRLIRELDELAGIDEERAIAEGASLAFDRARRQQLGAAA